METPRRALLMKVLLASFEPRRDRTSARLTLRSRANPTSEQQAVRESTDQDPGTLRAQAQPPQQASISQMRRVELAAVFLCAQVQSKLDDAWLPTRQQRLVARTRAHDATLPSPGPGGGASSFSAASSQYPNLG